MQEPMRTTIELSESTHARLRAKAAERGMRGFSAIVEEALERLFEEGGEHALPPGLVEAEGAWSEGDIEEWERAREGAWATWPAAESSTPTS
jgi:hypothetical protein